MVYVHMPSLLISKMLSGFLVVHLVARATGGDFDEAKVSDGQ